MFEMIKKYIWVLLFGLIFMVGLELQAQLPYDEPFGNMSREEYLEAEELSQESSDALVLLNFRAISFVPSVTRPVVDYYELKRYKILSEEGLQLAKQQFTIDKTRESLISIKALTYQLNPQGELVSYKVKKSRMNKEKVDKDLRKYSFSLPVVRIGSIIEVMIHRQRKSYNNLENWEFQLEYPVIKAEHHSYLPAAFEYSRLLEGNVRDIQILRENYKINYSEYPFQTLSEDGFNRTQTQKVPLMYYGKHETLILEELPPLKQERFSPEPKLFIPRVSYQLLRDRYFGRQGVKNFSDWDKLYSYVERKYRLKKLKARPKEWKKDLKRLRQEGDSERDRLRIVFEEVPRLISWDSTLDVLPDKLKKVWSREEGSGAEINLIAYALLLDAGLEAYPILISTVDHGPLQTEQAYLEQFNHVILGVVISGEMLLVDLVNGQENLNTLPARDLNQLGLMMGEEGYRWLPLRQQNPTVRYTYSRFRLDESGTLIGEIEEMHRKQSLAEAQSQLAEAGRDPKAYWQDFQLSGLSKTLVISGNQNVAEGPETLSISCRVNTEDFTEVSTNVLIVNPMMIRQIKENPFDQEVRLTPVDLTRPLRESHLLGLEIPEGYEVVQSPEPIKVVLPNEGGVFVYNFTQMDNFIHVSSSIFLNQTLFLPSEYENLKRFFDLVVKKHREGIVIAKKNE